MLPVIYLKYDWEKSQSIITVLRLWIVPVPTAFLSFCVCDHMCNNIIKHFFSIRFVAIFSSNNIFV